MPSQEIQCASCWHNPAGHDLSYYCIFGMAIAALTFKTSQLRMQNLFGGVRGVEQFTCEHSCNRLNICKVLGIDLGLHL